MPTVPADTDRLPLRRLLVHPPDPATATPAEQAAHAVYLRRLAAIGALPGPRLYPHPATAAAPTAPAW